MLDIINTEAVMMFLFITLIVGIIGIPTFYFIKHILCNGDKFEKRMIIGSAIFTAIIIIL
jgi:hypothetical protein